MTGAYEKIDKAKTDTILALLLMMTSGPAEAYGILAVCIHRLNFEMIDNPADIDALCTEITMSLRSVTDARKAAN